MGDKLIAKIRLACEATKKVLNGSGGATEASVEVDDGGQDYSYDFRLQKFNEINQ